MAVARWRCRYHNGLRRTVHLETFTAVREGIHLPRLRCVREPLPRFHLGAALPPVSRFGSRVGKLFVSSGGRFLDRHVTGPLRRSLNDVSGGVAVRCGCPRVGSRDGQSVGLGSQSPRAQFG
jgi:hypothetical protein